MKGCEEDNGSPLTLNAVRKDMANAAAESARLREGENRKLLLSKIVQNCQRIEERVSEQRNYRWESKKRSKAMKDFLAEIKKIDDDASVSSEVLSKISSVSNHVADRGMPVEEILERVSAIPKIIAGTVSD